MNVVDFAVKRKKLVLFDFLDRWIDRWLRVKPSLEVFPRELGGLTILRISGTTRMSLNSLFLALKDFRVFAYACIQLGRVFEQFKLSNYGIARYVSMNISALNFLGTQSRTKKQ